MLDLSLLMSALPESYKAIETSPGEYLVEGHIDPQVLATVTAWCARLDVLATDMRVEQRSLEDVFLDLTGRELTADDRESFCARDVYARSAAGDACRRCWPRSSVWS